MHLSSRKSSVLIRGPRETFADLLFDPCLKVKQLCQQNQRQVFTTLLTANILLN